MSPVRRAFTILLVAAGVVTLLLMLAQDQETLEVRSAVGAEEPRHSAYLAALVGAPLTRGNRYDVLTNGDQIFRFHRMSLWQAAPQPYPWCCQENIASP